MESLLNHKLVGLSLVLSLGKVHNNLETNNIIKPYIYILFGNISRKN